MKKVFLSGLFLLAVSVPTLAQPTQNTNGGNNQNGGVFELPGDINRVISVDAQNVLIVESGQGTNKHYDVIPIRHVYSGGIAKLFGGTIISTEQFASPGLMNGNGGNQNNDNAFGVNQAGGFNNGNQGFGVNQNGGNGSGQNLGFNPVTNFQRGR